MLITDAAAARLARFPLQFPGQSSSDSGSAKGGLAVTGRRGRGRNGVDGREGVTRQRTRAHIASSAIYAIRGSSNGRQRWLWGWTGRVLVLVPVPVGQNGIPSQATGRGTRSTDGAPPGR